MVISINQHEVVLSDSSLSSHHFSERVQQVISHH